MCFEISKSNKKGKRFKVKIDGTTIHFGSAGGQTFIDHQDKEKRKNYIARHSKLDEDWSLKGYKTAGFWSRWLLWEFESLERSIKVVKKVLCKAKGRGLL